MYVYTLCTFTSLLLPCAQGILMLNITGCELISTRGLKAAVQGLPYVQLAESFFGFKPVDDHINRKLEGNILQIQETAAGVIGRAALSRQRIQKMRAEFEVLRRDKAARQLQGSVYRYKCRQHFYRICRAKLLFRRAKQIQVSKTH